MAFTVWLKYYPIVSAFFISLFRYDPINPPGKFVGFENYVDIFSYAALLGLLEKYIHFAGITAVYVFFDPSHSGIIAE